MTIAMTKSPAFMTSARLGLSACALLALAGCAQTPRTSSSRGSSSEIGAFPQKKYGKASERVVGDGADVPRGGGSYHVGKPYTVAGRTYYPSEKGRDYTVTGMSSWYGAAFHGRRTANGEIYDKNSISAAHPTMPLPSYARVTNLRNNRSIIVRVNDRGPYHGGRVLDVSERVADALEFKHIGTARIKVDYVGAAGLGGSDDRKLLATLRTDGPANLEGFSPTQPTAIASTPAPRPPAPPLTASASALDEGESEPVERAAAVTELAKPRPSPAPVPPLRPFDLGTIPGAGVPIAAFVPVRTAQAAPPQSPAQVTSQPRAPANASAFAPQSPAPATTLAPSKQLSALYFAEPMMITRFAQGDPFAGLKPVKLVPWRGTENAL